MNPSGKIQNNSKLKQQQNYQNRFTMKKNRLFLRILGYIAVLSGAYSAQAQTPGLSYPVPLDEAHFPDAVFRECVEGVDYNGDGQLSAEECGAAEGMYISFLGVTSLEGIEYFYALETLDCSGNDLTSLDLSANTALTDLRCYSNQLTSLDLSANTALTDLRCYSNQLTILDLSANTALTDLWCYSNQLTSLDLSENTALTDLRCYSNQLTDLDLSENTALLVLNCDNNQLTSLDLSANTYLWELKCSYNHLAALDLSRNSNLRTVDAENNYYEVTLDEDGNVDIAAIPGLEADRMTDLQGGRIEGNTLHLDADMLRYHYDYESPNSYPSGGYFYIATDNPAYYIPIDKEHFPDTAFRSYVAAYADRDEDGQLSPGERSIVTDIYLSGLGIRDLRGIEYFPFLESLDCRNNQLTSLDLSANTALEYLDCRYNQLTSLDLSKNTALEELYCTNNRLACLDLSQCKNLRAEVWQDIGVEADESNRFNLADFIRESGGDRANVTDVFHSGLSEDGTVTFHVPTVAYYYETGIGQMWVSLTATNYQDYVVVEIDEAHFPDFVFRNYVANNLDFNRNGKIEISESGGSRYENGQLISSWTALDVSGQGIQDLQGIEYFPLIRSIDCSGNNIDSLGLSGLEHLDSLDCSGNPSLAHLEIFDNSQLITLDCSGTALDLAFSQYPNLHTLACADMGLTALDLKGCTALTELDCSGNELVSLDLSGNAALQRLNVNRNRLPALDLSRNTALQEVSTDNNYHLVEADEDRNVYLSTIPGLEADRMDNLQGGSIEGNTLHMDSDTLTYYYYYESPSHDAPLGGYFHIALKTEDSPVFIPIDEEHFPDAVFREYIADADMDADGQLSELEVSGVTGIDVSGMGIQDLRGIEYFTELESLDCSGNELTSLDLSANAKLQSLNAENNRLDIVLDERDRFDLSQLPGFEMAKASDWTGCTRIGNNLTFKQQEVTYSYATGYNGENEDADMTSVIFSLMADRDPSVGNETSDLQPQGKVYAKDHRICTEGIDTEISIYSASGSLLYRGFDKEIPVRHDGLYLVRSGARTWKVLVM